MTKAKGILKSLREYLEETELPFLDEVIITDGKTFQRIDEGQWVSGRFDKSLRIDQPTHGVGQTHGHVFGRKGHELGVVNIDGSASHGTKMKIHPQDADALRARGFAIRKDNIVEWIVLDEQPLLLLD